MSRAARAVLKRKPVDSLDAETLMRELVEDAVAGYPTPLDRFVRAVERIALEQRRDPEEVYQRIKAEVAEMTGRIGLPML